MTLVLVVGGSAREEGCGRLPPDVRRARQPRADGGRARGGAGPGRRPRARRRRLVARRDRAARRPPGGRTAVGRRAASSAKGRARARVCRRLETRRRARRRAPGLHGLRLLARPARRAAPPGGSGRCRHRHRLAVRAGRTQRVRQRDSPPPVTSGLPVRTCHPWRPRPGPDRRLQVLRALGSARDRRRRADHEGLRLQHRGDVQGRPCRATGARGSDHLRTAKIRQVEDDPCHRRRGSLARARAPPLASRG